MTKSDTENTKETLACLIIDDPLLRPTYGCLDYNKLLEEMKLHNFFTEIGFIPWNYKRSDPKTVCLFLDNPDHYAICIHGCNHGNEFGKENYQEMRALLATALWRMEQHKRLTGLPYDPVFVFPRGRFSSVAMKALKDQGYFAAFNSKIQATDAEELPAIEYRQPATKIYHNFPLFLRRYPKDKSKFIEDMTSGRPIIIVEHHGAFWNGYKSITDLVDWINSLGNIKWCSLLKIAEYYLGTEPAPIITNTNPPPYNLCLNAKVAMERYLCEYRDNYLEKNIFFAKAYKIFRG